MASTKQVTVGWQHPETEESFRVTCSVTAGRPARGWDPGDSGEIEVVEVAEDAPGGAERPDLIADVEADLGRIEQRAFEAAEAYDGPDTLEEARGER